MNAFFGIVAIVGVAIFVFLLQRDTNAAQKRLSINAALKAEQRLELMRLCQNSGNALLRAIAEANPGRTFANIERRLLKIGEELGEASEAYLVASTTNKTRKKKTYKDVREELMDISIVALDCALTRFPGEDSMSDEDIEFECMEILARKLAKWKRQKDAQIAITDELSKVDDAV